MADFEVEPKLMSCQGKVSPNQNHIPFVTSACLQVGDLLGRPRANLGVERNGDVVQCNRKACPDKVGLRSSFSLNHPTMRTRILITGASGSGTITLGRALATRLTGVFYDGDDYYWVPTDPPFQRKQDPAIRLSRLLQDLQNVSPAVLAGSILNWGLELEESFSLIVFLTVPAEIRVVRLREREVQRSGRVDPAFLAWAGQYDEGTLQGRSLSKHEKWLAKRSCPVLRIDGDTSTECRLAQVLDVLNSTS